jgi:hypothetical protein
MGYKLYFGWFNYIVSPQHVAYVGAVLFVLKFGVFWQGYPIKFGEFFCEISGTAYANYIGSWTGGNEPPNLASVAYTAS